GSVDSHHSAAAPGSFAASETSATTSAPAPAASRSQREALLLGQYLLPILEHLVKVRILLEDLLSVLLEHRENFLLQIMLGPQILRQHRTNRGPHSLRISHLG